MNTSELNVLAVVQNDSDHNSVTPEPDVTTDPAAVHAPPVVGAQITFPLPKFRTPIVTNNKSPTPPAYPDGGVTVIDELNNAFNANV